MTSSPPTRLIYGFHPAMSRLKHRPESVLEIHLNEQRHDQRSHDIQTLAQKHGIRLYHSNTAALDKLSKEQRHQGIVLRVDARMPNLQFADLLDILSDASEPPLLLILDGVQDPHNLGACLRVADGAGAHAVIAPRDRSAGLSAAAIKVASGAADSIPYITVTNLARAMRQLKEAGVFLYGAAGEATQTLYSLDQKLPTAWVLGAEAQGLRRLTRQQCDQLAQIPLHGSVDSLNVSVASGICLFEARRQRALRPN